MILKDFFSLFLMSKQNRSNNMHKTIFYFTLMLFTGCNLLTKEAAQDAHSPILYMITGSYSSPDEEGIHVYTFNQEDGIAVPVSSLKGISNPSFLYPSANGDFIYSVAEDDDRNAAAYSLSFNKTDGTLSILNSQLTDGGAPCYINADPKRRFVVTANYTGGNITLFPLDDDGVLLRASQILSFTGESHLHSVVFSPDDTHLLAADLGSDRIYSFRIDTLLTGKPHLLPADPVFYSLPAGSGPRHTVFHPSGKWMYLINELSGMVTGFEYKEGILSVIQHIRADTLQAGGSADIHVTPDGHFLYASNRLQGDGLAIFAIDTASGQLTRTGYQPTGIHPRNFIITPNGRYLLVACRDSNVIQIFRIDPETGALTGTGKDIYLSRPVCIRFMQ